MHPVIFSFGLSKPVATRFDLFSATIAAASFNTTTAARLA